ncbi:unnamed protein product, partial [Amoebophrya sp. A25]
ETHELLSVARLLTAVTPDTATALAAEFFRTTAFVALARRAQKLTSENLAAVLLPSAATSPGKQAGNLLSRDG